MDKTNNKGMGVLSVLTIVFVIAKITGYIAWSWWLVFLPIIIQLVIAVLLIGIGVYFARD